MPGGITVRYADARTGSPRSRSAAAGFIARDEAMAQLRLRPRPCAEATQGAHRACTGGAPPRWSCRKRPGRSPERPRSLDSTRLVGAGERPRPRRFAGPSDGKVRLVQSAPPE